MKYEIALLIRENGRRPWASMDEDFQGSNRGFIKRVQLILTVCPLDSAHPSSSLTLRLRSGWRGWLSSCRAKTRHERRRGIMPSPKPLL